jgi:hypothetical protein
MCALIINISVPLEVCCFQWISLRLFWYNFNLVVAFTITNMVPHNYQICSLKARWSPVGIDGWWWRTKWVLWISRHQPLHALRTYFSGRIFWHNVSAIASLNSEWSIKVLEPHPTIRFPLAWPTSCPHLTKDTEQLTIRTDCINAVENNQGASRFIQWITTQSCKTYVDK